MKLYIGLFTLLLFAATPPAVAQSAEERAEAAIQELKEGTLLVRLPSRQRKMDAMEQVLNGYAPDDKRRARMERLLQETQEEAATFNRNMMTAFRDSFDFAKVRFFYDYNTPEVKAGETAGLLLNEDLEADPSITLPDQPAYILGFGQTNKDYSDGLEAMFIMSGDFERMGPPFPYYQRLNDFAAFMGSIFPAPNQEMRDALRVVGKLDQKLDKFYERVEERE
ncbi:MAG TPA: hypothetical protein VJ933_09070 [Phaeodactylibacter sp.]|nr:hypothetical protein [Phaeodactylibacter sp.]